MQEREQIPNYIVRIFYHALLCDTANRINGFGYCIYYSGESHLGYNHDELIGQSWYASIHPDDVETARSKHRECKFERLRVFLKLPSGSPRVSTVNAKSLFIFPFLITEVENSCFS